MRTIQYGKRLFSAVILSILAVGRACADGVTDWNLTAREIAGDANLSPAHSNRALAIVHTSIYDAVNTITKTYTSDISHNAPDDASVEAAMAAAARYALLKTIPEQREEIETAYSDIISLIPGGKSKQQGIKIGERAAGSVWADRKNDISGNRESYRPYTTAGQYVPTVIPAVPHWGQRRPWMLTSSSQFRPAPPPALTSEIWAQDFAEVKKMGEANSAARSSEQSHIAKFWEATLPPIYHGLVHSVANVEGRSLTQNARLFAAVTRASDDALIAVFDAKYHYGFWRPVTAIRNADRDNNANTERDPTWSPYIPTPMHPEYPCAHCVVAATVGTILEAEIGDGDMPVLSTISSTANDTERRWTSVDAFINEVSDARIYDGVHYRNSTDVGTEMGKQIGALAAEKYLSKSD